MRKLLPSPSISSSSTATTSTTNFEANMCTSKNGTASCLSGILRRILCSTSLPTHPSDQITETSSLACDNKHQEYKNCNQKFEATASASAAATTNPGIVARLMGLEPLPETSQDSMQVSAKSITRSRSMNSLEFRGESDDDDDDDDQKEGLNRRVKSTLSVREMPAFVELENEEFFVLSFENGSESNEGRSKWRKCEKGFGEKKLKRKEKRESKGKGREEKVLMKKNEENKEEEMIKKMVLRVLKEEELSNRSSDKAIQEIVNCGKIHDSIENTLHWKEFWEKTNVSSQDAKKLNWMVHKDEAKSRMKKKKKKKQLNRFALRNEERECTSEDSSPVSVLDFDQFTINLSEECLVPGEPNSRRKLSPELDNCNQLSPSSDIHLNCNDQNSKKSEESSCHLSTRKVCPRLDHSSSLWGEICRLAEAEIAELNWIQRRKIQNFEDFDDISADFGLQILDQLLEEILDQFA